ncbi:hypothetical protein PN497_22705, partial [Sphaerospermopsis kisseleviana CS-549]|nr:hypothetical protein [Sphaerospermopsis kisseleviana CS-549]
HERITSWENPIDKAVWQLKQVCQELPSRPITLWDIEYGCAPFVIKTAEINADKLMRLRSNLLTFVWGSFTFTKAGKLGNQMGWLVSKSLK